MAARRGFFFTIMRIVGGFIVGLALAVVIALSRVNLESLRGSVLNVLQKATGMPVEIDGAVSWKFSLRPQIELNDVRIPNAQWAKEKYAFAAQKVDVTLNLTSLFKSQPTIQNIKIYDADINLEKNEKGEFSFELFSKKDEKNATTDAAENSDKVPEQKAEKPKFLFEDPGLGEVEVKNLTANILGEKYELSGFQVRYSPTDVGREYTGWIKFAEKVFPFIVSFGEYNTERKIYPLRVALATVGDALIANIALEGTSKMPIDFIIKGDIPDATFWGKGFSFNLFDLSTVHVDIAGGMDYEKITLRKSTLVVHGNELNLSGSVDWSGKIPEINANLESKYIKLDTLFPDLYKQKSKKENQMPNVFKDISLFGTEFLKFNLNLDVKIGDFIVYRDLNIKDLDLALNLYTGKAIFDIKTNMAGGNTHIAGDVTIEEDGRMHAQVAGNGKNVSVGQILNQIYMYDFISGLPMNFDLFVRANGRDLSEIMQTVTGPVVVYSVSPGQAHSPLVAYMYGTDFMTSLRHGIQDLFNDEKKYNNIEISCVALNAKLRNGNLVTENGFAVETQALNVRLAGNLDLGGESMKMSLITVPVRGLKLSLTGNVVNSMELTGNLAQPDMKINGAAMAGRIASATGIGLLLAPFTGGIGLVAGAGVGLLAGDLIENWLADEHPCRTAMERGAPVYRTDPEWLNTDIYDLTHDFLNR